MAKRKRASLKDKSSEALGLTQKKNRGIDLLFGGAVEKEDVELNTQFESESGNENDIIDETSTDNASIATENDSINSDRPVDELGLPVALEAPPDDLILASAPGNSISGESETDAIDPATSPFALPASEISEGTIPKDADDLTGILDEASPTAREGEIVTNSEEKNELAGLKETVSPESDLTGLIVESPSPESGDEDTESIEAVSGSSEDTTEPEGTFAVELATDLSGLAEKSSATDETTIPGAVPHTPPPPPVSSQSSSTSTASSSSEYYDPNTAYTPPPPSPTPTYAQPTPIDRAPQGVINALSTFAEEVPLTRDSFAPKDEFAEVSDHTLSVAEFQAKERDEALTQKVLEYIGKERRDNLFNEIEQLYSATSKELSGNRRDVNFALDTLLQAHDLVLEDPREYDEAFYRVAIVKTMLNRKSNLRRWSYTWGTFVLIYGISWLVLCIMGYLVPVNQDLLEGTSIQSVGYQAWFSGLAGGVGGAVAILWALYYRVSVKQDFDRQYLMWYLVKPILGFVLGLVMYFLLIAASSLFSTPGATPGFDSLTGIALSIFFGFVAGFRQDHVYDWIYVIIKAISPKAPEESQRKSSLVASDLMDEVKVGNQSLYK